jgi:hypothetical protein
MRSQRPSETTTGRTIALIFRAMVTVTISELPQASTQDGGNSLNTKDQLSLTRKERFLKLWVELMVKTKTLELTLREMKFTNNGILYMLTNGKENQSKENLMKDSDSTLKEISTLFQLSQIRDTLT